LKPHIVHDVPATREAIERKFGPRVGELFVANPSISEYKTVLLFPNTKVVVSGEIVRALKKISSRVGAILVIARDLTKEARESAIAARCDIMSDKEFGWTDASYQAIRQRDFG
jgi:hypothetical protein